MRNGKSQEGITILVVRRIRFLIRVGNDRSNTEEGFYEKPSVLIAPESELLDWLATVCRFPIVGQLTLFFSRRSV